MKSWSTEDKLEDTHLRLLLRLSFGIFFERNFFYAIKKIETGWILKKYSKNSSLVFSKDDNGLGSEMS